MLNGTFKYEGNTYIVDDVKYVASNPDYMKRAYPDIDINGLRSYLQELARAPSQKTVDQSGQICLRNYYSKYIRNENGKRVTLNKCIYADHNIIHIFGDSRVSGYMIEDKDLFSNILQDECNKSELHYSVINYGIPGREIERMEYQVRHAHIARNDLVFILTGCYEYRDDAYAKQQEFVLHLKKIKQICDKRCAKLCYVNLPTTIEMFNPSDDEKTISTLYNNYKFCEYNSDLMEQYKEYLLMHIQEQGICCHDLAIDFNKYEHREKLLFINMHHYSPEGNFVMAIGLKNIVCSFNVEQVKNAKKLYYNSVKAISDFVSKEKKIKIFFIEHE